MGCGRKQCACRLLLQRNDTMLFPENRGHIHGNVCAIQHFPRFARENLYTDGQAALNPLDPNSSKQNGRTTENNHHCVRSSYILQNRKLKLSQSKPTDALGSNRHYPG